MSVPKIDERPGPNDLPALAERGSLREVALLAYPVVLTNLSMTAMGFVDTAMVGRLGPTPLAAVGFSGIWLWTLVVAFFGAASGVQTFVSQADGAGRTAETGAWTWQAIWVVTPPVVLLCVLLGLAVLRAGQTSLLSPLLLAAALALGWLTYRGFSFIASRWVVPMIGSPPIPMHVDWPMSRNVSWWTAS